MGTGRSAEVPAFQDSGGCVMRLHSLAVSGVGAIKRLAAIRDNWPLCLTCIEHLLYASITLVLVNCYCINHTCHKLPLSLCSLAEPRCLGVSLNIPPLRLEYNQARNRTNR